VTLTAKDVITSICHNVSYFAATAHRKQRRSTANEL